MKNEIEQYIRNGYAFFILLAWDSRNVIENSSWHGRLARAS